MSTLLSDQLSLLISTVMDQLSPLDLSVPNTKEESPWSDKHRRNSVSDGESGHSSGHRSGSESPSLLSVSPSPSDVSDPGQVSDSKHHLKRFLHKYQAEQQSSSKHDQEHVPVKSLVNNKDLLSYGKNHQDLGFLNSSKAQK